MAATRQRIVETFRELSSGPLATPVKVSEVAQASGIATATIYRHFPNRDELVHTAAFPDWNAEPETEIGTWGVEELRRHLRTVWSSFQHTVVLVREGAVSGAGREMRRSRLEAQRGALEASARAAGIDPSSTEGRRYLAAVSLVSSSYAFLDLHDRQGFDAEEAADIAVWMVSALAAAAGADPQSLWTRIAPTDQ